MTSPPLAKGPLREGSEGAVEAWEVRCSGCRRIIGYSETQTPKRNKIYCSVECLAMRPTSDEEDRNSMWCEAVQRGISPVRVARLWGASHSLVYKTVDKG